MGNTKQIIGEAKVLPAIQTKQKKTIKVSKAVYFRSIEDKAAEREFESLIEKYTYKGKGPDESVFYSMDDMFEARIRESGGRRIPNTTSFPTKSTTFVAVPGGMMIGTVGKPRWKLYNAFIDDKSYNCHAYTFADAKKTKISRLSKLVKKIPKGPVKGRDYYDAPELLKQEIHMDILNSWLGIYPRWIQNETEVRRFLESYRKRKTGEKLVAGRSIIVYELNGGYPHSSKVIKVDSKGDVIMARGKFGHYSLYDHHPLAVPPFYGKPVYYIKK